jgi:hypothetical protein
MDFQVSALPKQRFDHLFSMPQEELALHGAVRVTAANKPGFPCRVSLEDAQPGEEVLLVNYEHLDVPTPYRSRYAVYVRILGKQATPTVNEVPEMLRTRTLSLRAWSRDGLLVGADLVEGAEIEWAIATLFAIPQADFLHAHFAKPGCYAARIDRV